MYIYAETDNTYTSSEHEDMQRSASAVNVYRVKIMIMKDMLVISIVKSRYDNAAIVVEKHKD